MSRQVRVTLLWVFAAGHLIRRTKWMRTSTSSSTSSLRATGPGSCGGLTTLTCWRSNTAKHEQSKKFLESIDDSFLTYVVDDPTRNGVLLNPK